MNNYSLSDIRVAVNLLDEFYHKELIEQVMYAIQKKVKGFSDPYANLEKLVLEKGTTLKRYELEK